MTLIFSNSELWIESFFVSDSVPATAVTVNDFTLKNAGRFVGVSCSPGNNLGASIAPFTSVSVRKTDDTPLVYGDAISQIRVARQNRNAIAQVIGAHVLVFIRK